ncbi:MAG: hypothetical protein J2P46_11855, partial [Zavarzinella sp.]|nr:hypothetical protein [Zavarzinella sp.]
MGSRNLVPGPPNHRRLIVWTALVLGVVALALVVYYVGPRHKGEGEPDSDPRRTFPTPFRNVRPEVQYVGDAVCAGCHADLSASYHEHPMGRSLAPAAVAPVSVREEKAAANPFEAEGFRYSIQRRDGRLFHRMTCPAADGNPITDVTEEIAFVVGSGERARSYLVNRDGFVYQSPISWFAAEGRFDLSPGYRGKRIGFSRVIGTDCLFCHSGQVAHVAGTVNGYEPSVFRAHAIGCERCHGPGELHAARQDRPRPGEPDETIVNPARLEHALAESVCEQCHLQGAARVVRRDRDAFDYRPGLPLDLFMTVFVRSTEPGRHSFVGHVEQMHASRCYQHSPAEKRMTCVSCHDPHRAPAPAEKAGFYRRHCLECHTTQGCTVPVAERERVTAEDSCVACHMPRRRTDDIDHVATTDHRIVRHGKAPPA